MALRTLAITLALTLLGAAVALAGPLKGKTYSGTTLATGTNNYGNHVKVHANTMTLKVSKNGKTVTVHFGFSIPVLYCVTSKKIAVETTFPAKISGSGKFTAKVGERFKAGAGEPSITEIVSGQFSGKSVSGSIKTEPAECGGVTHFSAKA